MICPHDDCGLDKPESSGYQPEGEMSANPKGQPTTRHTPTPCPISATEYQPNRVSLKIGDVYIGVLDDPRNENVKLGKFIVRAVNSHEANEKKIAMLLRAARIALDYGVEGYGRQELELAIAQAEGGRP